MESLTLTEVTSETEKEKDLQFSFTSSSGNERGQACQANSSYQTLSGHLNTKEKDTGVKVSVGKPFDKVLNSHDTLCCNKSDQSLESNADRNSSGNSHAEKDIVSETDKYNIRPKNKNAVPRRSISSNAEQDRRTMHHSHSYTGDIPLGKDNTTTKNKNAFLPRSKSSLETNKEQDKDISNSPPQQRHSFSEFVKSNVSSQTGDEDNEHSCKILSHLKTEKDNESSLRTALAKNEENSESDSGFSLLGNQGYQAEVGLALPNATSTSIVYERQTDQGSVLSNTTSTSIVNSTKSEEFVSTPPQATSTLPSELGCADLIKSQAAGKKRDFVLLFPAGDQEEAQHYADHLKKDISTRGLHNLTVDLFSDIDSGQTAIQSAETLHDRYNYILILVTINLQYDMLSRFIHEAILLSGLADAGGKENRVIPVWSRQECRKQIFALKHVHGFEYYRFVSDSTSFAAESYIKCVKEAVKRGRESFQ